MSLQEVLLVGHSLLRWIVLVAGVAAFVRAVSGARAGRAWSDKDSKVLQAFIGIFDMQILLGLLMYVATSPLGVRMLQQGSATMKDSVLRFFALEHIVGMILASAILHVGSARARRLGAAPKRQTRTAIVVGIGMAIILCSIPWPFFPYGRPLLRLG